MREVREFSGPVGKALERFFFEQNLSGEREKIGAIVMLQLAEGPFIEAAGGVKISRLVRLILVAFMR